MPAVFYAIDGLRVAAGVYQADLLFGHRMHFVFRESDVFVELDERQSPLGGKFPDRFVVGDTGVVPVGTQYDDSRFAGRGVEIFRRRVVAQLVAFGHVSFDYVVVCLCVVSVIEGCFVIGIVFFQLRFVIYVAVVYVHDHQSVDVFQLFAGVERAFFHLVGGGGDGFAADSLVDRGGIEFAAAQFEPAVYRYGERCAGE